MKLIFNMYFHQCVRIEKTVNVDDLTPRHLHQSQITQTLPHITRSTPMMSFKIQLQITIPADRKFITKLTQLHSACVRDKSMDRLTCMCFL